jgi:hypothetical protein|nr:MAG TPA: tail tube protein [Caudoviricetes sp.]DAL96678.1 MAG TPA: tail tube protein [Caudoviricetes sp.]DAY65876.1 MAG TPA: tail tube protein [Caudoviricetes sp.]
MLANGAKLEYKKGEQWVDCPGLKEIPDIGNEPEKVDNTCLTDKHKVNENGIGDLGDMTYKFKYDNSKADCPYRVFRDKKPDEVTEFRETLADGSVTEYSAQTSVKRTGGAVNGVIEFELTMAVQSDFTYTDPA